MLYRENGQFKSSYRADAQIFPIRQDRIGMALLLAVVFVAVQHEISSAQTRSMILSPKSPCGRTSRKAKASM